jgi:acyl-CoA synthetase (AMP-forming)/AMP-acid ligase II
LRLARAEQITHAFVVPTMLYRIVEAIEAGEPAPETLTTLAYGGAPMPRPTIERALRVFPQGTGFVNAYGLTETSSTITLLGPDEHRAAWASPDAAGRARLGSVGRPIPGVELRLAETGEILVRGAQVGSNRRVDASGWFHTGDLGRLDDEGYLYIVGRADDMIIRGGENISPVEVEEALRECPGVRDAAVVGVDDAEWGQRVEAAIECASEVTTARVLEFVTERLPGFKRPERLTVVDALPRNDMGKVLRREVRRLVTEPGMRGEP